MQSSSQPKRCLPSSLPQTTDREAIRAAQAKVCLYTLLGHFIRNEMKQERVHRLDVSYLGSEIDQWWSARGTASITEGTRSSLRAMVLNLLKSDHRSLLKNVGSKKSRVAAVFLEGAFTYPHKDLGGIVHEVFADIAGIVDIKYPYEDHKVLFPKSTGAITADWGKGLGVIRPHSDDLYEEREIDVMELTVCRDVSKTPTSFWLLKDVIACLSDREVGVLASSCALFSSGRNVEGGTRSSYKPILRNDPWGGVGLRLDFRIDETNGARMKVGLPEVERILQTMRDHLGVIKPVFSNPSTGSVSILANFKVLHGRSALNPEMLYEGENSRILVRSKGFRPE